MKTTEINKSVIGKRVKGVFCAAPVTGTIIDIVEYRDPVYNKLCSVGVRIKLDKELVDGTGIYTEYDSTARLYDGWGNLQLTNLI